MNKILNRFIPSYISEKLKQKRNARLEYPYVLTGEQGVAIAIRPAHQSHVIAIAQDERLALIYVTLEFQSSEEFKALQTRIQELGFTVNTQVETGSVIRTKYGTSTSFFGSGIDDKYKSTNTAHLESLISQAIAERAREIRFHVRKENCGVVHNIDGEVFHVASISAALGRDLCSNAYTNMADKSSFEAGKGTFSEKIDQSCMMDLVLPSGHFRIRYQSMPEDDGGYDVTMRIQPQTSMGSDDPLVTLGLTPSSIAAVKRVCNNPIGGVYVTGPMGQGKTTTLYAAMYKPRDQRMKYVMTFEDPVEYKGFGMTRVNVAVIGYRNAIKRALRMGIHAAMISEIRDHEMGLMANVFSQTGLKVFTTMHVLGAHHCIDRLSGDEVKIPRQIICDTDMVAGFIYQRLVPKLCTSHECTIHATEELIGEETMRELRRLDVPISKMRMRNEAGCSQCKQGRYGSQIVIEIIEPDEQYMRLMREGLAAEAKDYWYGTCRTGVTVDDVEGKPIIANALYHVAQGTIDINDLQRHLGWIKHYRPLTVNKLASLPLKVSN